MSIPRRDAKTQRPAQRRPVSSFLRLRSSALISAPLRLCEEKYFGASHPHPACSLTFISIPRQRRGMSLPRRDAKTQRPAQRRPLSSFLRLRSSALISAPLRLCEEKYFGASHPHPACSLTFISIPRQRRGMSIPRRDAKTQRPAQRRPLSSFLRLRSSALISAPRRLCEEKYFGASHPHPACSLTFISIPRQRRGMSLPRRDAKTQRPAQRRPLSSFLRLRSSALISAPRRLCGEKYFGASHPHPACSLTF